MAQISAVISTTDQEFRVQVTRMLRASGLSIGVTDERHIGNGTTPDLAIADIRGGATSVQWALERLRTSLPSAAIIAVAASSDPEQILLAMRAGANEFLAWANDESRGGGAHPSQAALDAALQRATERIRAAGGGDRKGAQTLSFFGSKGGAGTTTVAVNTAIDIARLSKRPTLIVDLHQFLGEVALFLGVRPRFTLVDAIDNLHRLDAEFLKELVARHKSGLDILAGADQVDRPGPQDAPALEQLLQVLGRTYEYIIIDAGQVNGPCSEVAVFAADALYLVANPDVASIRNTQRLVNRMEQLGAGRDRLHVLLNRTSEQHVIAPKQIESALGHKIHHTFASDYSTVSAALNAGEPLTLSNHTALAAQFGHFTHGILNLQPDAEAPETSRRRPHFLGLF